MDASCNEPMVTRSAGSEVKSGSSESDWGSDRDGVFSCEEVARLVASLLKERFDGDTIKGRRCAVRRRASMSRIGDDGVWARAVGGAVIICGVRRLEFVGESGLLREIPMEEGCLARPCG